VSQKLAATRYQKSMRPKAGPTFVYPVTMPALRLYVCLPILQIFAIALTSSSHSAV